ncbi:NitT/TauT family transport system substrate-binding protein [Thermanaeromonas toyohensis ToBE]|uniref:NitT/TauT family transport system substrate-binding protein n=1 Tax=Thermanaeromonas toyohensis ToBE TaxID=698762 RepID=A0A1W1VKP6_9FIRM|nr:ABC transporter substrate-binding protein [Thermanaeromonas toyohensis]SMB93863.1 NitT/TauT family transport system substrate-binding protein [Thermanaeromonas toyohensis ToBE]
MRWRYNLLISLVLFLTLFTGCGIKKEGEQINERTKIIKLGYLPITHSLPLIVADNLKAGKFEGFKLELVRFSSWPELTEALNSGQIQGAITMLELALVGYERGVPLKILSLSHRNGDVLVAAKEISSVSQLKGKRVAIPHRLSGHNILLYRALTQAGLDYNAVEKVEMAPPEMPAALARKEIAAYIVAEPFGARSVTSGTGQVLLRAQDIWSNWICCGLVMNSKFVEANPETVKQIVAALVEAGNFVEKNKDQAIEIAQKYLAIERPLWEKSLSWISYSNLTPSKEELEALQNALIELPWEGKKGSLLAHPVNLDTLVDTSFITQAYRGVK